MHSEKIKRKKKNTQWVLAMQRVCWRAWENKTWLAQPGGWLFNTSSLCWHCFPEREVGLIYGGAGELTGILTANEHRPQNNFLSVSDFMISWLPIWWENLGLLPNICHLLFFQQSAGEGRKSDLSRDGKNKVETIQTFIVWSLWNEGQEGSNFHGKHA